MPQIRTALPDPSPPPRWLLPAVAVPLLALLVPGLLAAVPPLADYPNHLARMFLLGGGADSLPLSAMYRVTWDTLTNIGLDLFAAVMTRVTDYQTVGRIIVAAATILPALGGTVLWRVVHGRLHWWQLSFGLLAWSMGLVTGFMNFEIGLGLAMLAAAADPALARRGVAAALIGRVALGVIVLTVHAFGFLFYAALLCGMALGSRFDHFRTRPGLVRTAKSLLLVLAALAIPVVLLATFAPTLPGKQSGTNLMSLWMDFRGGLYQDRHAPLDKLENLFASIWAYLRWLDVLTALLFAAPLAIALATRRLAAHAGLLLAAACLVVGYLLCPRALAGTYWVDSRFSLMAPFILAVALRPDLPALPARAFALVLLAGSLLRTGINGWIWHDRQADVAAVLLALEPVPAGAAILPLQHTVASARGGPPGRFTTMGEPTFSSFSALAVPDRHAFVPTLFAARGKQPIMILPPWAAIADPDGGLNASLNSLDSPAVYDREVRKAPYLTAWRTRFDYVLVMNADMPDDNGPFTPPPGMTLVRDERSAQLYRLDHAGEPAPPPKP